MTRAEFFIELNHAATVLQSTAARMATSQEQAQWLYLETIYQGLKNPAGLEQHHSFVSWLLHNMKCIFWNQTQNYA